MKFIYLNDTERVVHIHPDSFLRGCIGNESPIKPMEERILLLPEGTHPELKIWGGGENELTLIISPLTDKSEKLEKNSFWEDILEAISNQVSDDSFEAWFRETEAEVDGDTLIILCVNVFQRDWINHMYKDLISSEANKVMDKEYTIIAVTHEDME